MGLITWCCELLRDMYCVQDDHPMTEKEFDRWQAGQTLAAFPGRVHQRVREERQHREIIEAIQRGRL